MILRYAIASLPRLVHVVVFGLLVNLLAGFSPMQRALVAERLKIVALGDSLTAGYLLPPAAAFPAQLQAALQARGHDVEILNAGVSGDTTAAGLARFDWAVGDDTDAVIVELGANDVLRGLKPQDARKNLDEILTRLSARGVPVLVAGMRALANWGPEYQRAFEAIFPELAAKHGALLYPFFLDGVAGDPKLNLEDGLYPNAAGIAEITARILPKVEELIAKTRAAKAAGAQ